jgi:diguanylate cyclase (GGDEF)-like protein
MDGRLLRIYAVAAAAFLALYALGVALRPSERWLQIQSEFLYNIPALAALALAIVAIWRSRGRERLGWLCLAGLLICWEAGEWGYAYYDIVLASAPPFPGYLDAFYYAGYLLFFIAIPLLAFPRHKLRDQRWLLDLAITMTVAGAIAWHYLMAPIVASGYSSFGAAVALGYPLLDIALLTALLASLYSSGGRLSVRSALLLSATAANVVSDGLYSYLVTTVGYDVTGNPLELGWIAAYLLIGACFLTEDPPVDEEATSRQSVVGLVLPYVAVLPLALLTVVNATAGRAPPVLIAGFACATLLVLARQFLTLRENLGLYRKVETALETERDRARRDSLTGVLNHAAIVDELRSVLEGVDAAMSHAVVMVDVDALKAVNDTYGHQLGDAGLVSVARALERKGVLVGRYGGDEFIAVLPETDWRAAERYCDAALKALAATRLEDPLTGTPLPVMVSLGVATYPEEAETVTDLVALSDSAMYAAKRELPGTARQPNLQASLQDDRAARIISEIVPLLTSPGELDQKLRLVAHRLSIGAAYDAVNFSVFADPPKPPVVVSTFARVPAELIQAWDAEQRRETLETHRVRVALDRTRLPMILDDPWHDERLEPGQRELLRQARLRSALVAPMLWRGDVVGLLAVASKREAAFTPRDAQFLQAVAAQVSAIVRLAMLVNELQGASTRLSDAQMNTVMLLANAAETHDEATGHHLQRVRRLSEQLALRLGRSADEARDLGLAAALHDIGKMRVPDHILSSSAALSPEEWRVMRLHTVWGAEFLRGHSGFELAAAIARSHHERWDGAGYPDGLRGERIPEAALIVTVADSFDAMTSDRPYRQGRSAQESIREIVAERGKQFAPRVVDCLLDLYNEGLLTSDAAARDDVRAAA